MPFIADAMLGKLARWLRILGFDTIYEPVLSDDALLLRAKEEARTLLTRDIPLHKRACRKGVSSFLLREKTNLALLKEASAVLTDPPLGSRCPMCNSLLVPKPSDARGLPVAEAERPSWLCPSCGKLYWHGSHWKGIRRTLILAGLGVQIGDS